MRRLLFAFASVVLMQSGALHAGMPCELATPARLAPHGSADASSPEGHAHHAVPSNPPAKHDGEHHNDRPHCAPTSGCGSLSLAAVAEAPASAPVTEASVTTIARPQTPHSFTAAPEPPPPKA